MKPLFVHDFIRQHILARFGMDKPIKKLPSLAELKETEWNATFEQLMRNRLIMGAFRYGSFRDPNKPKYDCITSMRQRLDLYEATGNQEHLVDVANICLVEYTLPNHPDAHWSAADDGIHATVLKDSQP